MSQRNTHLDQHKAAIIAAYRRREPSTAIGNRYGVNYGTIINRLREWGEPIRGTTDTVPPLFGMDEAKEIAGRYSAGASIHALATEMRCSGDAVKTALRACGVRLRTKRESWAMGGKSRRLLTAEQEAEVACRYLAGENLSDLAVEFGCSTTPFVSALGRQGVPRRPLGESNRKYTVDHGFFAGGIRSERHAWLWGYIATDGCVHGDGLTFVCAARDRQILETVRSVLSADYPIRDVAVTDGELPKGKKCPGTRWYCHLAIRSRQLCADLARLGIAERKTFTVRPPEIADPNLEAAMYRGMVDGDGSVVCTGRSRAVQFCGNKAMVDGFLAFAQKYVPTRTKPRQDENIWQVAIAGRAFASELARVLYDGAEVALERKRRKAAELMALPALRAQYRNLTAEVLSEKLSGHAGDVLSLAAELGMRPRYLRKLLDRREVGREKRPVVRGRNIPDGELVSLYRRLGTRKAVADHLGIPRPTVYSWFSARNLV